MRWARRHAGRRLDMMRIWRVVGGCCRWGVAMAELVDEPPALGWVPFGSKPPVGAGGLDGAQSRPLSGPRIGVRMRSCEGVRTSFT